MPAIYAIKPHGDPAGQANAAMVAMMMLIGLLVTKCSIKRFTDKFGAVPNAAADGNGDTVGADTIAGCHAVSSINHITDRQKLDGDDCGLPLVKEIPRFVLPTHRHRHNHCSYGFTTNITQTQRLM